jgi:hypothetical protein
VNLHSTALGKMEYIQKLFLTVQEYMLQNHELEELICFLDSELSEFRSVAYESASMEKAHQELSSGKGLNNWESFYQRSAKAHTFHMDIGLGWAFAKTENLSTAYLESLNPFRRWMVFDGIGYYYGLFKGRKTVKSQVVPEGIDTTEMNGFDQGLGRRLWYIATGQVKEVMHLIQAFPMTRHPDLWRGVGIACGYVGGNKQEDLELLSTASGGCKKQLQTGITLAAISRIASNSVTADVENACQIVCNKTLKEIKDLQAQMTSKLLYIYTDKGNSHWITQFESELP